MQVNIFISGWTKLENIYRTIGFYNLAQLYIEEFMNNSGF